MLKALSDKESKGARLKLYLILGRLDRARGLE